MLAAPPFASHKKHIRLNIKIVVTFITQSLNAGALIQEKNYECFFDKNSLQSPEHILSLGTLVLKLLF